MPLSDYQIQDILGLDVTYISPRSGFRRSGRIIGILTAHAIILRRAGFETVPWAAIEI